MNTRSMLGISMAVFAFAGGASLVWYGTYAFRKFKDIP
jgi:small neutral amino acid transporter SnatA (MarC family)